MNSATYNPNLGTPNRRPVSSYSGPDSRDLPKSYAEAREAFERADKRRGGARGRIAHNTTIHVRGDAEDRSGQRAPVYAVRLHDTDIVTFYPDLSIGLDSGGYMTFTTRDRMNRCGIRVGLGGGAPFVFHGASTLPYVDGMRLKFRSDGTPGMAWYPSNAQPVGTVDEINARRRRVLAKYRRDERAYLKRRAARKPGSPPPNPADVHPHVPFYWPLRTGGHSPHRGTVPETFRTDSECGLKPRDKAKEAAFARAVSGVQS